MGAQARVDRLVTGRRHALGEHHVATAANAVAERAETIGRRRAVALEAAALAPGCRLAPFVQRALKVPSRCSSAFEVFWPAGNDAASVGPGTVA